MASVDQRLTIIETEFRTELKHLATKADLRALETKVKELEHRLLIRLGGLIIVVVSVGLTAVRLSL